ncbi:MAG: ExbD/TolR family protein [Planctomycetota bacterium]
MRQSKLDDAGLVSLRRKRRQDDAEMDITPMIDIVFLLLIFFLVASKMDEAATVKLPPAQRGINVSQENAIIIIVKKNEQGDATVARRDGEPFSNALQEQEREVGEYVDAGLSGTGPFDRPMESIIVKAQGNVREGEVARVAEAIGRVTDIDVLHYAVLEER